VGFDHACDWFTEILMKMLYHNILRAAALWLLLGLPGLAASAGDVAARLLVVGDSLSAAYGLSVEEGWVALLEQRFQALTPPLEVVNASLSGETPAGALERLPGLLARHQPQILLLALGANDGLRGFPLEQIANRLERLIALARASDARVLLLGVRLPPNYGATYSQGFQRLFAELAERTGVVLVPQMLDGVAERWELMQADGLHPTAEAQPLILENLWPSLQKVLSSAPMQAK
jgi:acyl-CoA thioesterase-1